MKKLIKNGSLVFTDKTIVGDILIQDGKIIGIEDTILLEPMEDIEVFDATGCLVFPGFIDGHTHLDMHNGVTTTADDFDSGTASAICGGTTSLIDFATQERGKTLASAYAEWSEKAAGKAHCNYGFHMAITQWNEDLSKEIDDMVAKGITSFKLYMAYEALRVTDGDLYKVLKRVGEIGGIVGVHCENGDLVNELIAKMKSEGKLTPSAHPTSRPDYVEAEAVARYCYIAKAAEVPIHVVHLSTQLGLDKIMEAKQGGQKVYIETCPQYLCLDDSKYDDGFESAKFTCSPPLRSKKDQDILWKALGENIIDTISTDHCSFNFIGQKDLGKDDFSKIPNGMPGLETRPQLIYTYGVKTGKITENQMTALLCENTAKLFGMYPQKGVLAVGSDADIVIWDTSYTGTITNDTQHSKCDYSPFEGTPVTGRAKTVFLSGENVVTNGELVAKNKGKYIHRNKSIFY